MKLFKKSFSLVLAIILGFSTFNFSGFTVNSDKKVLADTLNTKISILEIQPGTRYNLEKSFNTYIGSTYCTFNVTQMPMSQFISTVDQINGKYDIVYVGNNTTGGSKYCAVGPNATKGKTVTDPITGKNIYPKSEINMNNNGYQETYSENDITYKRAGVPVPDTNSTKPAINQPTAEASGLVNFINSGQLTLFDKSIFRYSTLNNTILYKQFNKYTNGYSNFIQTSSSSVMNDIVNNYINCNRKPTLNISAQPLQYKSNTDGTPNQNYIVQQGDSNYKKLKFNFDMGSNISGAHPVKADLYLDMNSDGLFQPAEALAHTQQTNVGNGFSIEYDNLPDTFFGLLNWKLEVTDTVTKAKNYYLGSVDYAGKPNPIKVLQLVPGYNSNFYMDDAGQFPTKYLKMNGVYDLSITRISAKAFSDSFKDGTHMAPTFKWDGIKVPTTLNGNYDMVILGFADSYGGSSTESDIQDQNALNEIKNFIATGQSVMFTHDTISDAINVFPNLVHSGNGWGYYLKNNFRDIIGQSRYADANNPSGNNIDGTRIPHSQYPNGVKEFGYSYASINGFNTTNTTMKINSGLINSYPYTLADNINVANTHDQWYQLNLEDEDVVPWYTLYGTNLNPLDARNYYYTYSKGNITFSGTGHSSPAANQNNNGNKDELELFVNTMYKASRSADHAPIVTLNADSYITKNQDLNFNFSAIDQDGDAMPRWKFLINSIDVTDKVLAENGHVFSGPINSSEQVNLKISKDVIKSLNLSGKFTLETQVFDSKGAEGKATKDISYVDTPTISLTSSSESGYLVGDTANVTLTATANSTSNSLSGNAAVTFPNSALQTTYDSSAMTLKSGSGWAGIQTVNYDSTGTPVNNIVQTNTLSFQLLKPNDTGNPYTVANSLNYMFSATGNNSYKAQWPFTLSVRQGQISVSLLDKSGQQIKAATNVTLTKPDGTTETKSTDADGNISFINEPSGKYTISAVTPSGYSLVSGSQQIDLSYDNYRPQVNLTYTKLEAPTITVSDTNWTRSDVVVTLTPPASFDSKVQRMQYNVGGGKWIDYDTQNLNNNKVTTEGIQNVVARTIDKENNVSPDSSPVTVKIDKTGPDVNITDTTDTTLYQKDSSGNTINEVKGAVTLHFNATDALVRTVNNTISVTKASDPHWSDTITLSGPDSNYKYTSEKDYSVNSNDIYTFTAQDTLGNSSSTQYTVNNIVSLTLNGAADTVNNQIDLNWNVPGPTQAYSYDLYRETGSSGGYSKIQTTDSTSYIDTNGKDVTAPAAPVLSDGNVTFDNTAVHINFQSVNDIGTSYKYQVDATGKNDNCVVESNEVPINNMSGIKGYYISIDKDSGANAAKNVLYSSPSANLDSSECGQDFYVHVQAVDNQGNISKVNTYHCVPPTQPNISITGIGQTIVQTISNIISANGAVDASIGGSTSTSSPITYKYYLDNDSNNWQSVNEGQLIPVNTDGLHTIYAKAIDPFGNFSLSSKQFLIDTTGPTKPNITTSIPNENLKDGVLWTKHIDDTFTIDGSNDDGSGVKGYQFEICKQNDNLDNTKWLPDPANIVSSEKLSDAYSKIQNGKYNIYGRSQDNLGNLSDNDVLKVGIDTILPPIPEFKVELTSSDNINYVTKVSINYPDDNEIDNDPNNSSGIRLKQYRINDSKDWLNYTGEIIVNQNDTIWARSVDYAGNEADNNYKVQYSYSFDGLQYDVIPKGQEVHYKINIYIGEDQTSHTKTPAPSTLKSKAVISDENDFIWDKTSDPLGNCNTSSTIGDVVNGDDFHIKANCNPKDITLTLSANIQGVSPENTKKPMTLHVMNTIVH